MVWNSVTFLFMFLPLMILLYYCVPQMLKNPVLLLGSFVFYAWGNPLCLMILLASAVLNYFLGLMLAGKRKSGMAKRILALGLALNMGLLIFLKYGTWELPMGMSFYTLQVLSYIIDVYRGKVKVQVNILDFAVYAVMFPKLLCGPVVRYSEMEGQLRNRRQSWNRFGDGAMYFIRGLAKKLLIADNIGTVFDIVRAMPAGQLSVLSAWIGCLSYAFQIYYDFSGYSDMAIGLGKMFGFEFPKNFDYPYLAKSVTEFWQRWHISLGTWFREYVYKPLGGSRSSMGVNIRNLLLVWVLVGLWHGMTWNYLLWGLYFAVLLLLENYVLGAVLEKVPGIFGHIYSFVFLMIGWVLFFCSSVGDAAGYLRCMAGFGGSVVDREGFYLLMTNLVLLLAAMLGATPAIHQVYERLTGKKDRERVLVNSVVYGLLLAGSVLYLVTGTSSPFMYLKF